MVPSRPPAPCVSAASARSYGIRSLAKPAACHHDRGLRTHHGAGAARSGRLGVRHFPSRHADGRHNYHRYPAHAGGNLQLRRHGRHRRRKSSFRRKPSRASPVCPNNGTMPWLRLPDTICWAKAMPVPGCPSAATAWWFMNTPQTILRRCWCMPRRFPTGPTSPWSYQDGVPTLYLNGKQAHQGKKGPHLVHSPVQFSADVASGFRGKLGVFSEFAEALTPEKIATWIAAHPPAAAGMEISGPWQVTFDPQTGGPGKVEFTQLDDWSKRPRKASVTIPEPRSIKPYSTPRR
jgi:hypothetical protein